MTSVQVCPVPYSQRPSNEYLSLKNSLSFGWTFQITREFLNSLMKSILLNYTVVYIIQSNVQRSTNQINPKMIVELYLFTAVLSIVLLLQSYLACVYVYNRLMVSSVAYEESGWYDGQIWIKSKKALLQDRLIGMYELQPKIKRLKIVMCMLLLMILGNAFIYISI